ncbi:hypothetical protein [Aestuariibacter salexigens]|uniref:hypothetical protein n=1 Tax=Aestuariibacter salexigens TaxID=226010 RepID=UPI0003FD8D50|nr:hypothetical protein [Aestuariibacter salexigens]
MAALSSFMFHGQQASAVDRLSSVSKETKWTYLIANSLTFSSHINSAIRLSKPDNQTLMLWLERLISGSQCARIYVENLQLSHVQLAGITALCLAYGVELHNVSTSPLTASSIS